jgi:glutathione synthase
MKIGFLINDIHTEIAAYTTVRLAVAARNLGHEVWLFSVADFIYDPDGAVRATAVTPRKEKYKTNEALLQELQDEHAEPDRILIDELDILLLRNDPAEDAIARPWAQTAGILFGKLAIERGVIVLNDPSHLAYALNKTYFQDIVGDKLMEINVFSPGGIGVVERLYDINFADHIIADLERKTLSRSYYGPRLTNVQLATL